jgi:hypothetical protein
MRRAKLIAYLVFILWTFLPQGLLVLTLMMLIDHGVIDVFSTLLWLPFQIWCLVLVTLIGLVSLLTVDRVFASIVPNRKL